MKVKPINNKQTHEWLLYKHYAKRIPSISYAYGLFVNSELVGCCTFGRPSAHLLVKHAFNGFYQSEFLELNRLIVNDGLPKNSLSFFVSKAIKLLPKPKVIVSFADTSQGHNGYIYQATNWIYTGLSAKRTDYKIKGLEHLHGSTVADMAGRGTKNRLEKLKKKFGESNVYLKQRPRKHRYFYFHGSKKDKKRMRKLLKYPICDYPKGANKRYDASYAPLTQLRLF